MKKLCPKCHKQLDYDTFEDDYICRFCFLVFYPKDFGEEDNSDAGYLKLNTAL